MPRIGSSPRQVGADNVAEIAHSDSRITERIYARMSPTYLRDAAEALEIDTVRNVKGNGTK